MGVEYGAVWVSHMGLRCSVVLAVLTILSPLIIDSLHHHFGFGAALVLFGVEGGGLVGAVVEEALAVSVGAAFVEGEGGVQEFVLEAQLPGEGEVASQFERGVAASSPHGND